MLKNIGVNFLKLVGGLISLILLLLLATSVGSAVMDYCFDHNMEASTAYLFSGCSLIFVLGLAGGTTIIVVDALYDRKHAQKNGLDGP